MYQVEQWSIVAPCQIKHDSFLYEMYVMKIWQMLAGLYVLTSVFLGDTLTSLGGGEQYDKTEMKEEEEIMPSIYKMSDEPLRPISVIPEGDLPDFVFDTSLDDRTRARKIENEMNEQVQFDLCNK